MGTKVLPRLAHRRRRDVVGTWAKLGIRNRHRGHDRGIPDSDPVEVGDALNDERNAREFIEEPGPQRVRY